jgi:hypothetical protein
MEWLIDHLAKEWTVIKEAPIALVLCFLLGVVVAWLFARHSFGERIALLERIIEDYKERLGLVPTDKMAYSKLTNLELRRAVGEFVPKLRAFGASIKDESLRQTMSTQMSQAKSEDERHQLWQRQTTQLLQMSARHQQNYDENFKTQAIVFRDEMLRRLPKQERNRVLVDTTYVYLAGPNPVGETASDLEQLSVLLPQR